MTTERGVGLDRTPRAFSHPRWNCRGRRKAVRMFIRSVLLGLLLLAASGVARADDYPTPPVTIILPFAAAGSTDLLARMMAQKLEQRLGKSFLIENKPGAGSTTGAAVAAKAPADGYTLLMAPSPT